jgi:iron complex transport system permease protein
VRRRATILIALLGAAAFGLLLLRQMVGPIGFGFAGRGPVGELRLLAGLSAAVIGASLAISGTLLQATLRNPLASPWVLGLTSGASLGVVLVIVVGGGGTGLEPVGAVAGAFGALGLVYTLARRGGLLDPVALLLIGVMVSISFGALAMLLQQFLPDQGLARFSRWMLGSISEETPWSLLGLIAALTVAGIVAASVAGPRLDAATLADDEARSVGVNPHRMRTMCFFIAGTLTAGTVLLAGPIGFVGLVCPHIARLLVGASHRRLVIASALVGIGFVVAADLASVVVAMWTASSDAVVTTGRIPVGIVTALIGAPVFIGMLLTGMRSKLSGAEGL